MIRYELRVPDTGLPSVSWQITQGGDTDVDHVCAWLTEQRTEIDRIVDQTGSLLIRGLTALTAAADFDRAIQSVSPRLRDYVGGTSPRRRVHGRIMTATEVPPTWSIPLHQEMAYTSDPPDRIAFFCQRPADGGGASMLGDMAGVLARVSNDVRDKCERHGLQLRRTLPSAATRDRKPGVKKQWDEVFETTDRGIVEETLAAKGWRGSWLTSDTLQIWHDVLPATKRHPASGRSVWFNQAHFFAPVCMMAWAERDRREQDRAELDEARRRYPEMLDNVFYGNGEPVSDAEAMHLSEVLCRSEVPVRLEASDLLLLDNTLVAHGRSAYSGRRDILVALIDN